jgi:hypothetical protein
MQIAYGRFSDISLDMIKKNIMLVKELSFSEYLLSASESFA